MLAVYGLVPRYYISSHVTWKLEIHEKARVCYNSAMFTRLVGIGASCS